MKFIIFCATKRGLSTAFKNVNHNDKIDKNHKNKNLLGDLANKKDSLHQSSNNFDLKLFNEINNTINQLKQLQTTLQIDIVSKKKSQNISDPQYYNNHY